MEHAGYPHEPGTLYDCYACENHCYCDDNSETCVYCAEATTLWVTDPTEETYCER